MGMHRDQARKAAGRARIAAAGLAVAGAAVLLVPFPKLSVAPAGEPVAPTPGVQPPTSVPTPIDTELWGRVLAEAGPEARPPALPEDEPPKGDTSQIVGDEAEAEPDPATSTGGPELRYLGPIVGPRRTLAMVALDGQQHIIAVGETVDGKTVREVAPDRIVLDDAHGVEHVISMAERVLDWSMDAPSPKSGHAKRLGANGRGAANPEHADPRENDANATDVDMKRMAEVKRLVDIDRNGGAIDEPPIANPPRNSPTRPTTPNPAIVKPTIPRGSTPVTTPPRPPPTRPTVPNKGKAEEKKAGNQV